MKMDRSLEQLYYGFMDVCDFVGFRTEDGTGCVKTQTDFNFNFFLVILDVTS